MGNWTTGPNSFESDVPNDALVVENTETGELETAVIESFNPVYDTAANTLTYTIMAENGTSINLPSEFGHTGLVMDDMEISGSVSQHLFHIYRSTSADFNSGDGNSGLK